MPRPKNPVPTHALHKPSGQAVVKVTAADGTRKTVYLGKHGSPKSRQEYERVLLTLRTAPDPAAALAPGPTGTRQLTVAEALLAYARHVKGYYPGDSARGHFDALRPVRLLAGNLLLREFTTKVFKAVRQKLIDAGQSRTTINGRMQKVGQFVRWAVAEELADAGQLQAIRAVPGLRKGRGEAKELPPVRPPAEPDLLRVVGAVPPAARALLRVQMVCGARAGELVRLKGDQLDRSGPVWQAQVADHKGTWRGKERTLYFGPQAQEVLAPLVIKAGAGSSSATPRGGRTTWPAAGRRSSGGARRRGCRSSGRTPSGTSRPHAFGRWSTWRRPGCCSATRTSG